MSGWWSAVLALMLVAGQQNPFASFLDQSANRKDAKPNEAVRYQYPAQVGVVAGKPTPVELHFEVKSGLHINSHTPKTKDLIATSLTVPGNAGVQWKEIQFPTGKDFVLPVAGAPGGGDHLSVYTGEFVVRGMVTATSGQHLVQASLRYQACDNRACMPPHTIPVVLSVIAH